MMTRLDEIGENYENFKAKVASYMINKAEQTRGGWKEMYFPMEIDHVSVYGELPTTTRKMQAARQAEGNLNQKQMEKSEACGSSRVWRRSRRKW